MKHFLNLFDLCLISAIFTTSSCHHLIAANNYSLLCKHGCSLMLFFFYLLFTRFLLFSLPPAAVCIRLLSLFLLFPSFSAFTPTGIYLPIRKPVCCPERPLKHEYYSICLKEILFQIIGLSVDLITDNEEKPYFWRLLYIFKDRVLNGRKLQKTLFTFLRTK